MIKYVVLIVTVGVYLLTGSPIPLYLLLLLSVYSALASLFMRFSKISISPRRIVSPVGSTVSLTISSSARMADVYVNAPTYVDGTKVVEVEEVETGKGQAVVKLRLARRGVFKVASISATLVDPLGLARAQRRWEVEVELVITPRPLEARSNVEGRAIGESEFFELREYTPNDDARRIDWKASARLGRLTVRDYRGPAGGVTRVLLDATTSMALSGRLEQAISEVLRMAMRGAVLLTVFNEAGKWDALVDRYNALEILARPNPALGKRRGRLLELKRKMLRSGRYDVVYTDVI